MHASAEPYVLLLRLLPDDGPAVLTFTLMGCVGMVGMNAHGVAVGINNLMATDGQLGVMWPFVVRKALQQPTVEAALACITGAKLAGAHNYLLLGPRGEGFVIEAMPTAHHVTPLAGVPLAHTNHCLAPRTRALSQERLPAAQQSSEARLADAHRLLAERPITVEALMGLTRDEQHICYDPDPETHVSTCGAVVMRPKTGDFWAVRGKPSATPYRHYTVGRGAS
jgi:isopenicillin-N N-acyltransferase-like protein